MFGAYRTLLAMMVVVQHLGGVPLFGGYAVFAFYVLSGYLMTLIMQNSYGYTIEGRARYALNRTLRIYPIYWMSCAMSLILLWFYGQDQVKLFYSSIYVPVNLESIFRNIFLVFPNREHPMLTPPSWALTVELFFYVCIGVGLSKTRNLTAAWFALSVIYTVYANVVQLDWSYRYYSIFAASLPFSTGAMIFHYRKQIKTAPFNWVVEAPHAPIIIFSIIGVNWLAGYFLGTLQDISFYINYILCVIMIIVLFDKRELPFISKKLDKSLGDFSYPMYLIHFQVGFLVMMVINSMGFDIHRHDLVLVVISLPMIFLFSWYITLSAERPIEIIRRRIRNKSSVNQ